MTEIQDDLIRIHLIFSIKKVRMKKIVSKKYKERIRKDENAEYRFIKIKIDTFLPGCQLERDLFVLLVKIRNLPQSSTSQH